MTLEARPDPTEVERFVILVACEKLEIEEADQWEIVSDPTRFGYRVAIKNQPVVFVSDEEIHRRKAR